MKITSFLLKHDPGPYPLSPGAHLSDWEVLFGLELESLLPGTQLLDLCTRRMHTVRRKQNGVLVLWPPCARLLKRRHLRSVCANDPDEPANGGE